MPRALGRTAAIAAVLLPAVLGLAACGESSQDKAAKTVCTSVNEIKAQLTKLQSLSISPSFPAEAQSSVQAIGKSITKIKETEPKLDPARKAEVEAANKAFASEMASITASVVSATKSSSLQAGLKSAETQIKASLDKLVSEYKKVFEGLKCS